MKIAMIGHKRIPDPSGGVEVAVEELSKRLVDRGCQVVAYNRLRRETPDQDSFQGIELSTVWTIESKNLDAVIYSYLATIKAILHGADVVHYHALGPAASLWLAKLFNKKVVVTVHGFNYKTPKWKGLGSKYIKLGERISARFADQIIVLSDSAKSYFKQRYGRETNRIPNGISLPSTNNDNQTLDQYNLEKNGYFLCVSRLVPGKGLETLIEAFKGIDCDKQLIIAGDSEFVDEYKKKLTTMGESDPRIRFIGFVDRSPLADLYSNAFAFVFPSEAEGMPISLLEAMWSGCLCVASDIEENVEVLGSNGIYFKSGNVESLISALELSLETNVPSNPDTSKTLYEYDWDSITDKTLSIYEGLVR